MLRSLKDLYTYRDLLRNLVLREVRVRYKGSVLGFLWSFVTPLTMFLVYYLVFSMLTKRFDMSAADYALFLLSGLLAWMFFQSSVAKATPSIRANGMLVRMVYFPRAVLPISTVLGELVFFLSALAVLFVVSILINHRFPVGIVALPVVLPAHLLLALGFGLIFATLSVFYRDTEQVVNLLLSIGIFASPVFYATDKVAKKAPALAGMLGHILGPRAGATAADALVHLYFWNPVIYVLQCYRAMFQEGALPSRGDVLISYAAGLAVFAIGFGIFIRYQGHFAEEL